jgi:hypothetical protein
MRMLYARADGILECKWKRLGHSYFFYRGYL